jgi:hypothetical protein
VRPMGRVLAPHAWYPCQLLPGRTTGRAYACSLMQRRTLCCVCTIEASPQSRRLAVCRPPHPHPHPHPARFECRLQDVRATEVDKVAMYDCFRPGDVVRGGGRV